MSKLYREPGRIDEPTDVDVERNTAENLALVLRDDMPPARDDAALRWTLAAAAPLAMLVATVAFGFTGFMAVFSAVFALASLARAKHGAKLYD